MDFLPNQELLRDTSKNTTLLDFSSFVVIQSESVESTESAPKDVNPVEGEMKREKICVFKENINPLRSDSAQSSLSSNFTANSNTSLEEDLTPRIWIENGGSLFSEFSSVNRNRASYCTSDDEDENLQQAKYGSVFSYDAFPGKAISPVIEPISDSLFSKDKRFEWVDSIWGSNENNAVHMAKLEKEEEKKKIRENTHLQRSNNLLPYEFNSQSRSRAGTPDIVAEQTVPEITNKKKI
jgi:hypothetical protein